MNDRSVLRVFESWRNIAGDMYELVVGLPEGRLPEIGEEVLIPNIGEVRVLGVWRADNNTAEKYNADVVLRMDVQAL